MENGSSQKEDTNSTPTTPTPSKDPLDDSEGAKKAALRSPPSSATLAELARSRTFDEVDEFIEILSKADDKTKCPEVPECVDTLIRKAEMLISNYEFGEKFGTYREEDSSFLQIVNSTYRLNDRLGEFSNGLVTMWSNKTGAVLHRAMTYLNDELRTILEEKVSGNLECYKDAKSPKLMTSESQVLSARGEEFPGFSLENVSTMNKIASAMINGGYESECCIIYNTLRKNTLREELHNLGNETMTMEDIHKMPWESLESEIATWIDAVKHISSAVFVGERKLCESVFSNHPNVSKSLFGDLARLVSLKLVNFAQAVALTNRSAEKLFKFLDMYEALRDFISSAGTESEETMTNDIKAAKILVGEAAVCMFCNLENSIKKDNSRTPVPSGAVHPLTRYTMNYLKYACEYSATLEQVFQDYADTISSSSSLSSTSSDPSPNENSTKMAQFSAQLMTVMELLDGNLDMKSKLYRDPSLRYIFLMNNGRYILQKVKGSSEINEVMGDNWRRKRSAKLREYHQSYKRETWSRILQCLNHEGLQTKGKVAKPVLKERFKSFNQMMEEIHRAQSTWVVSDEQLQSELRASISGVVIPAYRSFLGRFKQYLDSGRQTEKYIKYQPEDIENLVDELFDGNPTSMARRR